MKVPKKQKDKVNESACSRRTRQKVKKDDTQVDDLLRLCLQKIRDLQKDLEKDEFEDTFEQGYSACANEAMKFLSEQGLSRTHPVMQTLMQKFLNP